MRSLKYLSLLLTCIVMFSCSSESNDDMPMNNDNSGGGQQEEPARTAIVDPAFEAALVALNFDNEVDGSVLTANIENVTSLVLNEQGISDISGIEDFVNLENLWINDNLLESLPIATNSKLKFIFADFNQISSINITSLPDLEKVSLIDNALESINVSNNFALQQLVVPGNQLTALDVSSNAALTILNAVNNPLTCVQVSSSQQSNIPADWEIDPDDSYSTNCN